MQFLADFTTDETGSIPASGVVAPTAPSVERFVTESAYTIDMNEAVRELFAGNDRHVEAVSETLKELQASQHPEIVTVCCGDSRVLQDDMWDNHQPGRVFTHSNIGNRVVQETTEGRVIAGDVLYPLVHTETHTAIVVGHTGCGAVTAAYHDLTDGIDEPAGIDYCVNLLEWDLGQGVEALPRGLDDAAAVNHLVEYNVDRQVDHLVESHDVPESVTVLGAVYDFHDAYSQSRGAVHVINVDGTRETEAIRERHPELGEYVHRLWEY